MLNKVYKKYSFQAGLTFSEKDGSTKEYVTNKMSAEKYVTIKMSAKMSQTKSRQRTASQINLTKKMSPM